MPYARKIVANGSPSATPGIRLDAIKSAAIGLVAAAIAVVLDASASEALLTYIAAGGSALAIMPYARK